MALLSTAVYLIALYSIYVLARAVYGAFLGPLSKIPGPKIRAISSLPFQWSKFRGIEVPETTKLHLRYGHVVRIAPNNISYTNGATAWKEIYGFKRAGQLNFPKDPKTQDMPLNGEPYIVIADDETHARHRYVLTSEHSTLMRLTVVMIGKSCRTPSLIAPSESSNPCSWGGCRSSSKSYQCRPSHLVLPIWSNGITLQHLVCNMTIIS
jgi:hypothetical protein